jgi:hypothetical protein
VDSVGIPASKNLHISGLKGTKPIHLQEGAF